MPSELAVIESPAVTPDQMELIKRTIAKDATPDELKLYFYDCQRQGVHPLDKLIHFTKRGGKYTPITSIDFMRSRASDSGEYAGNDDAVFREVSGDGKHPLEASVTVYRMVQGTRCPFTATARWSEYLPEQAFMWKKMPFTMLGKCAEALALRKAFPRQLSGLYAAEEMAQSGRKPPEEQGELHESDPDTDAKAITLAGEITEEKEGEEFFWYGLKTLVDGGSVAKVYVKSPKDTDSGRLADKIGYLVSLKVFPGGSSAKGEIFILSDVIQVRKPATPPEGGKSLSGVPKPRNGQSTQPAKLNPATNIPEEEEPSKIARKRKGTVETWQVHVGDVELRNRTGKGQFLLLTCQVPWDKENTVPLICWHKDTLFPELLKAMGKDCEFGVLTETKGDETHFVIEKIERIGKQLFADNKPIPEEIPTGEQLFA